MLGTPPPHILRLTPPLVPEPRTPVADPEATGLPGGYLLPGRATGAQSSDPATASEPGPASGAGDDGVRTVDTEGHDGGGGPGPPSPSALPCW